MLATDRYLQPNRTFKHCSVGKAYKYYTTSPFSTCLKSAIRVIEPCMCEIQLRWLQCIVVVEQWWKYFLKTKISQSTVNLKQLDLRELSLNCLPRYEEDISQYELCKWLTIRIQLNLITLSQSLWRDEDIWLSDYASVSTFKNISWLSIAAVEIEGL